MAGDQLNSTSNNSSSAKTESYQKSKPSPVRNGELNSEPKTIGSERSEPPRRDDIWTRMILPDRHRRQPGSRIQRQLSDPGSQIFKYLNRPAGSTLNGAVHSNGQTAGQVVPKGQAEVSKGQSEVEERFTRPVLKRSQSLGVSEGSHQLQERVHR